RQHRAPGAHEVSSSGKEKGRHLCRPFAFSSVVRPVGWIPTSRASRACQEDCFPKGRSAGATLRLKPLDIGSPPFVSLNTKESVGSFGTDYKGRRLKSCPYGD